MGHEAPFPQEITWGMQRLLSTEMVDAGNARKPLSLILRIAFPAAKILA
jgi:hypothetical protein